MLCKWRFWIAISGGNIEKNQVSARNIFGLNYYLYLCNSKLDKAHDSFIIHARTLIK